MHDVCIVGAGPAGLSAALVLGRCGRDVIVFDSGQPRNRASRALHGYLTRDGVHPLALRDLGRSELARYPSVHVREQPVVSARPTARGFVVAGEHGREVQARFLLLATGRADVLPLQPGFRQFYGRGVYHCPYCDGWEHRHQHLVAFGRNAAAAELALALLTWSSQVTLCTDGAGALAPHLRAQLDAFRIRVVPTPVAALHGDTMLREVRFDGCAPLACDALFFSSALPQKSALPEALGCELDAAGAVVCERHAATRVPGLYVAGNVRGGVHLAIMAAAEGAEAAIAIDGALQRQSLAQPDRERGPPARINPET